MADNVEADAGSGGATFASDDIGGVQYPRVKITLGADGSDDGDLASGNPMPIAGAVTNAGTFAVQVDGDALTSLQLIDDAVAAEGAALGKGVLLQGDDGTDRTNVLVDTSGHLQVDVLTAPSTAVTNAGTFAVQVSSALPAGTNAIGKLAANSGVDIGDVDVTSIAAGSNLIGDVGLSGARTSGGTTIFRSIDLDESEEEIKSTAGQVYWIHAMNLASGVRYLKFYNATAASVSVGTTTPVLTFALPTQGDANGAGFTMAIPNGIAFGTAITVAATTGVADSDTGAPGANEVLVNIGYA